MSSATQGILADQPTRRRSAQNTASRALAGAAALWLVAALIGQWLFAYYITGFYGPSAISGHYQDWTQNHMLLKGYVAGDTMGNLAFLSHVLLAAIISVGGALQLIPQIRKTAPRFHRWNGRVFIVTVIAASLGGLYMVWARGASTGPAGAIAISGNAVLILVFVALAGKFAVARDIATHRRWALRTYVVANGVWFERVGFFAWLMLSQNRGASEFFSIWMFGCYLLPLVILEFYLRAKNHGSVHAKWMVAGTLTVFTLLMSAGIFGITNFMWLPLVAKV